MPDTAPVKWLPWKMLVGRSCAPFPTARVIVESGTRHIEVVEDLFAPDVTDSQRDRAFVLMAIASALTFRVVTRYPAAARLYLSKGTVAVSEAIRHAAPHLGPAVAIGLDIPWVWLLLRASSQADLDQGVPELLETPAAVRGVLLDGLVEKVDLTTLPSRFRGDDRPLYRIDALRGQHRCGPSVVYAGAKLDWIVLRGQTGPDAKPMSPDTARSVRKQCQDAQVPFYFEGWGEWAPMIESTGKPGLTVREWMLVSRDGAAVPATAENARAAGNAAVMVRIGAKHSGRLLDGKVWDEMPEVAHA